MQPGKTVITSRGPGIIIEILPASKFVQEEARIKPDSGKIITEFTKNITAQ